MKQISEGLLSLQHCKPMVCVSRSLSLQCIYRFPFVIIKTNKKSAETHNCFCQLFICYMGIFAVSCLWINNIRQRKASIVEETDNQFTMEYHMSFQWHPTHATFRYKF